MLRILLFDIDKDFVRIITAICYHHAASKRNVGKNIYRNAAIIFVSRRELKIHRIPKCVNNSMNFRGLSTSTHSDLWVGPLFPLDACWCTLIVLESILRCS